MSGLPGSGERIVFDRASVRFPTPTGPLLVVDDVSFAIADGEFVALIGPSGCGKTTMLNLVAGFVQPTGGRVLLDGRPIRGPGPERGVIFQEYGVFPWLTVAQNIDFGLRLRANRVSADERERIRDRYMRLMGLAYFARAYPADLVETGLLGRVMPMPPGCVIRRLVPDHSCYLSLMRAVPEHNLKGTRVSGRGKG